MPEVACEWCGKIIYRNQYRIEHTKHHFCSDKCRCKSRRNRLIVICEWCGKVFDRKRSAVVKYKHHFCSGECRMAWRKSLSLIVTCTHCGKKFKKWNSQAEDKENHFCSPECRIAWQRLQTNTVICEWCGKTFERSTSRLERSEHDFCSKKCYGSWQSVYLSGANSFNWNDGASFEPYSYEFNNSLKEQIIQRDHYQCQLCGITEDEHIDTFGSRLSVHHIDYDKQNNRSSNLIALCKTCHGPTNSRRKYYTKLFSARNACIERPV